MPLIKNLSTALMVRGGLTALFGVLAMIWPVSTVLALVMLWGAFALVDGIVGGIAGFSAGVTAGQRIWAIVFGVLGVVAGLFLLVHPVNATVALTWVLGIWLIAHGIVEVIASFGHNRSTPRWLGILAGVFSLLAGWLIAANPGAAALGMTLWLGVLALGWGIFIFVSGMMLRSSAKEAEKESTPMAG